MITGHDLIQLGNRWAVLPPTAGGGEAVWRTSINRLYYGAFHLSWSFLIVDLGIIYKNDRKSKHQFVQNALRHSGHPECEEASQDLIDLQVYRNIADYDLRDNSAATQQAAIICHTLATKIRDHLRQCHQSDYPAIKRAIEHWQAINK